MSIFHKGNRVAMIAEEIFNDFSNKYGDDFNWHMLSLPRNFRNISGLKG